MTITPDLTNLKKLTFMSSKQQQILDVSVGLGKTNLNQICLMRLTLSRPFIDFQRPSSFSLLQVIPEIVVEETFFFYS